jgi:hypothetical protein
MIVDNSSPSGNLGSDYQLGGIMGNTAVKLVFTRRKRVGRKSWNPSHVEILIPIDAKPKMLPAEGDVQLYVSGFVHDKSDRVKFDFSLTARDEFEMFAGGGAVDTLVGLHEVWIQIRNIDPIVPEGWITKPKKHVEGD